MLKKKKKVIVIITFFPLIVIKGSTSYTKNIFIYIIKYTKKIFLE